MCPLLTCFQYNSMPTNFIFMAVYFVLSKGMFFPQLIFSSCMLNYFK